MPRSKSNKGKEDKTSEVGQQLSMEFLGPDQFIESLKILIQEMQTLPLEEQRTKLVEFAEELSLLEVETINSHLEKLRTIDKYVQIDVNLKETLLQVVDGFCKMYQAASDITQSLEKLGPGKAIVRQVPNAFLNGYGEMPNNPLIAAGIEAIFKGGKNARILQNGWSDSENDRPIYQHRGSKGGRIIVYPNPTNHHTDPLLTNESLWEFVESLNVFTSDVVLAVLAQLCEPSTGDKPKHPMLESVRITSDAILSYKGIQRWGTDRQELRKRVHDEMEKLRSLYFDVEKFPASDPTTKRWESKGVSWEGDRFFDIVKVEVYQNYIPKDGKKGEIEQIELSWLVRAGQWAYWWLNAQGRVWMGRIAHAIIELDHREVRSSEVLAKKLGQRLMLLLYAIRTTSTLELKIGNLLEDVGELVTLENRDKNWAPRTRDRFDEAILKLKEIGVFSDVTWPLGYGPGDSDRGKGWVEKWLASSIKISFAENLLSTSMTNNEQLTRPKVRPVEPSVERSTEGSTEVAKLKRGRPKSQESATTRMDGTLDGSAIRQARIEWAWSQEDLAKHLDISRTYLSQIEMGKRKPSKELTLKLNKWWAKTVQSVGEGVTCIDLPEPL
ncbi:MAG: helix-turn-helix domain-containing protein [Chloroflexi bacterium]|nr:helix-turn-helix domain-containing protein [Chloroflexota bacterium]